MKALHGAGMHLQMRVSDAEGSRWNSDGRMFSPLDVSVGNFVNGFVLV